MVRYPVAIDSELELPISGDNSTQVNSAVINNLRSAIIAIESELGTKPSSSYGTVRNRLNTIENTFTYIMNGSLVLNGTAVTTPGGALTVGQVLRTTDVDLADWGPLDLANADAVTGTLPSVNQAAQTLAGDVIGTTSASLIDKIAGMALTVGVAASTDGYVLKTTGANAVIFGLIENVNISPSALIDGFKIFPDFEDQDIVTSGSIIGGTFITDGYIEFSASDGDLLPPILKQLDKTTNSSVGDILRIQAQNATGTTSTGGALYLTSGTGTTAAGNVIIQTGGTARFTIAPTSAAFADSATALTITPVSAGTTSISAATGVTAFNMTQADKVTNSGTGATLTIQAQNETGTTSNGGPLVLTSGTGTTAAGNVTVSTGGTARVVVSPTTVAIALPIVGSASAWGSINSLFIKAMSGSTYTLLSTEYISTFVKVTGTGTNVIKFPAATDAQAYTKYVWNAGSGTLAVQDANSVAAAATLAASNGGWFLFSASSVVKLTASFATA